MCKEHDHRAGRPEEYPLGLLLGTVLRKMRGATDNILRQGGLSSGQIPVLMATFRHPGLTQIELARKIEIAPSTLNATLKRMEAAGLICRETDPKDSRSTRISLTDHGVKCHGWAKTAFARANKKAVEGMGEERVLALKRALVHIMENIDSWNLKEAGEETDLCENCTDI